ncbi:kinase binding protein CGI-121-domain-containing protein [Xylaria longipes]|nr:kinase binding protein CGI-121-domain-containing protein [Xylaria longipes]
MRLKDRKAASPLTHLTISVMGSDIQQPIYSHNSTYDSQSPDAELNITPTTKRQKIEHQTHHPATAEVSPSADIPFTMSTFPILETLQLEHVPATHSVHVAVFQDIENAAFLHQQLLARNADFEYALIDAGVITSRLQVLSAAFKAITVQLAGAMKTPNVHSEIVHSLNPTKNIAEAYRRHGITPTTRNLVIVKVLVTPTAPSSSAAATQGVTSAIDSDTSGKAPLTAQDVEEHLRTHVQGKPVPFTDETLSELTDWGRVRKYYKLNGISWLDGIKDQVAKNREMDMLVMGGMALRGV